MVLVCQVVWRPCYWPCCFIQVFMGFIVVALETLLMRGSLSIPLCSTGCLCQGSLLLFGVLCWSPLGSLTCGRSGKKTVHLVPHLLCIWLKCEVSRISLSPSHLFVSRKPHRFQFPKPFPSAWAFLAAVPSLYREKGSSRLPLGPRSPQGPASRFPPPAQGLCSARQVCHCSFWGMNFSGSIWRPQ